MSVRPVPAVTSSVASAFCPANCAITPVAADRLAPYERAGLPYPAAGDRGHPRVVNREPQPLVRPYRAARAAMHRGDPIRQPLAGWMAAKGGSILSSVQAHDSDRHLLLKLVAPLDGDLRLARPQGGDAVERAAAIGTLFVKREPAAGSTRRKRRRAGPVEGTAPCAAWPTCP